MNKDDILRLSRRDVRYQLYRIRTYVEGGPSHMARTLKDYYEKQEGFTNWSGFAREWDIDVEGEHYKIIKRDCTEEQEWNTQLASLVVEL